MVFWLSALVLAVAAILIVLRPVFKGSPQRGGEHSPELEIYKDQLKELDADIARGVITRGEGEAARTEISRRLLKASEVSSLSADAGADVPIAMILLVGIAGVAITMGGYFAVGSPGLPGLPVTERIQEARNMTNPDKMIAQIERQLERQPNDLRGWSVLAPVYMGQGRYRDAADAFHKAIGLSKPDAGLQAAYGEALAMANDGLVGAKAQEAFQAALKIDAKQIKARFFLGMARLQDGDKDEAIRRWEAILADAPEDSPWRGTLKSYIQKAKGSELNPAQPDTKARSPELDKKNAGAKETPEPAQQEMVVDMIDRLASRLAEDGGNLDDWLLLIRARAVMGKKDEAEKVLSKARAIFSGDTNALGRLNDSAARLGLEAN